MPVPRSLACASLLRISYHLYCWGREHSVHENGEIYKWMYHNVNITGTLLWICVKQFSILTTYWTRWNKYKINNCLWNVIGVTKLTIPGIGWSVHIKTQRIVHFSHSTDVSVARILSARSSFHAIDLQGGRHSLEGLRLLDIDFVIIDVDSLQVGVVRVSFSTTATDIMTFTSHDEKRCDDTVPGCGQDLISTLSWPCLSGMALLGGLSVLWLSSHDCTSDMHRRHWIDTCSLVTDIKDSV